MQTAELQQICAEYGFTLSADTLDGLAAYLALLNKWNKVMNLVGPYNSQEILRELILDSFHLAQFLEHLQLPATPNCWDFGAGAGLPGIPLRLVWNTGHYTLVEAREKRALFLQNALAVCHLPRTTVYRGRAENFMAEQQKQNKAGDLLLSRAFMPWEQLLPFAYGGLAQDARVVCLTLLPAPNLPGALAESWRVENEFTYATASGKARYFWTFRKK